MVGMEITPVALSATLLVQSCGAAAYELFSGKPEVPTKAARYSDGAILAHPSK